MKTDIGVKGNTYGESILAISPCIFLLTGHGTQLLWTLNILPFFNVVEKNKYRTSNVENEAITVYYFGGILGVVIAAGLISTVPKKVIYVSIDSILCCAVLRLKRIMNFVSSRIFILIHHN